MDRWISVMFVALGLLSSNPVSAQTIRYVHTDVLGNVVLVTDQDRNVVERHNYEPFGLPSPQIHNQPGFTGHVHDADTGLVYMQQRYYDPEIGRFLSIDPVPVRRSGDNFNRYWYANNNPTSNTDPDGRNTLVGAAIGCGMAGPACPAGAAVGAVVGTGMALLGAAIGYTVFNEIVSDSAQPPVDGDRATGDDIKFTDKVRGQLGERGWSEQEVRDLTNTEPSGTSVDNQSGRDDPASVYGTQDSGHVIVNDANGEVVQVSNKNNPDWRPDPRIHWNERNP